LHISPVGPTHRQTDTQSTCRTTSVAIVHIYALHAGDADEKCTGI